MDLRHTVVGQHLFVFKYTRLCKLPKIPILRKMMSSLRLLMLCECMSKTRAFRNSPFR